MATDERNDSQTDDAQTPQVDVQVEDAGEAAKKLTITVGREQIDAKFDEMFGELHENAAVPGFRKGHAPRRLLEKRFGKEVREDVRNVLVSESLQAAVEQEDIEMLGEPEIDLEQIEVPDEGDMTYSVEVEVKPEFELPEYKNIEVEPVSAEVTDERLDEAVKGVLSDRGQLKEVEGAAEKGDLVAVDVKISGDDVEAQRKAVQLRVAPGAVEGIPLETLDETLAGAKAGETVTAEAEIPQGHENEDWRGKKVTIELTPREIKRLEVPELTDEIAEEYGFDNAEGFRDHVRSMLENRLQIEAQQQTREQLAEQLLAKTDVELPAKLAERQAATVLRRRYVDLLYRGVPRDQIDQNLELLQARAAEQARRDLKLQFILEKIAEAEGVEVTEGEVNARVAQMAMQYGRRPERLRQEMAAEGSLGEVETQLREQKTMDTLLEMATGGAEGQSQSDDND